MFDGTVRTLTDVRHVPELKKNLISLGTLDSIGCDYRGRGGVLKVSKGTLVVMKGEKTNGLYLLKGSTITGAVRVSSSSINLDSTKLWHVCLGHMSERGMMELRKQAVHQTKGTLNYIHSNLWGPSRVPSKGGARYMLTFIDDYSRRVWVHILKRKDEVFVNFKQWKTMIEKQAGKFVKRLRTDNGLEFCQGEFNEFYKNKGIVRHHTVRYTPQQNEVAERMNRTLLEKAWCMLSNAGLPNIFWAEAVNIACYLVNRSPSTMIDFKNPVEKWSGTPANFTHLNFFGYPAYAHVNDGKLEPVEKKCIFLGLARDMQRRNVRAPQRFRHEDLVAYAFTMAEDIEIQEPFTYREANSSPESKQWSLAMNEDMESLYKNNTWELAKPPKGQKIVGCKWVFKKKEGITGIKYERFKACLVAKLFTQREGVDFSEVFTPVVKHSSIRVLLAMVALHDMELKQLDVKMEFLHGELEEKIYMRQPEGFVIQEKFDIFMSSKGYSRSNYDSCVYHKKFPDAKKISGMEIIRDRCEGRLYLSQNKYIEKPNVMNSESIGIDIPLNFIIVSIRLKQSPRQWYKRFDIFMISKGYSRSNYDSCVYHKKFPDGSYVYLLLYVDDMLIASKNMSEIDQLKAQLKSEFEMKDLGAAKKILGMEIIRDRRERRLYLSQKKYIEKVLQRFRMNNSKPVSVPLAAHFKLSSALSPDTEEEVEYMSRVPYASAIGSIMYAMVCTRPDIAQAVSVVSRYMDCPGKSHWEAVQWILRYLRGTTDFSLMYDSGGKTYVTEYVDSDYDGDLDRRRSLTGYVFTLGGCAISWKATLQSTIALSTTEAEYMAMAEGIKEAIWLKGLVGDLGMQQDQDQTVLHCDSQSAIHLSRNQVYHERTKHIDVRYHFIREVISEGIVHVRKIRTTNNPAYMMTKPVTTNKFKHCLDLVGVCEI
ncbi:transposable element [Tanacetum coccineum]